MPYLDDEINALKTQIVMFELIKLKNQFWVKINVRYKNAYFHLILNAYIKLWCNRDVKISHKSVRPKFARYNWSMTWWRWWWIVYTLMCWLLPIERVFFARLFGEGNFWWNYVIIDEFMLSRLVNLMNLTFHNGTAWAVY